MKLHTSRWLQAFALLAMVLALGCGAGDSGGANGGGAKRFIFITNGDDPFWDACNAGLQDGAKTFDCEAAGIQVVMEKNNGTAQGQIDKLRQFASQSDIAGVAISVIQADNAAIIEEMKNLQAKGVKGITVDGDANLEKFPNMHPYYIGTNNAVGGEVLGQACRELLKARGVESGGYVQFAGFTDNDNARSRMNGFQKAVGDEYTEKDRMPDEMNLSRARDNVRNALNNHPDVVALVGIWAYNAPAIAEVVEERMVRDKTTVVTFDAQAIAIEHMNAGGIDAMVVQNPFEMGRQAVRLLKALHDGDDKIIAEMFPDHGQPGGDIYTTGLRLVVPDEGSPLQSEDFDAEVVEYIPLSKFQAWLKKYNLTSS